MKLAESPFLSLQGEGISQGAPTIFVRLQGCNLHPSFGGKGCCSYCDTAYAQAYRNTISSIEHIVSSANKFKEQTGCDDVLITGGEPLVQKYELEELVEELQSNAFFVTIGTNGTLPKPPWWQCVEWNVDIKCPSSGVVSRVDEWLDLYGTDQVKFVVKDKVDFNYVMNVLARGEIQPVIVLSPVIESSWFVDNRLVITQEVQDRLCSVAELAKELNVRYSLQLHKVLWGNRTGV